MFTGLAIVLGSIWGKPAWGTWWTWDPRLTTTAILFLIYVGYLAVRRLSDNPRRRGRWAAVVGIVGFADVPDRAPVRDVVAGRSTRGRP